MSFNISVHADTMSTALQSQDYDQIENALFLKEQEKDKSKVG